MPCNVVDEWLTSGRSAWIGPHRLRPVEHALAKGKPLSSQKGQAEAFFLIEEGGAGWILKKFRQGCTLASPYLTKIAMVLPRDPAFSCGTERQILTAGVLQNAKGYHYSKGLDRWLEGTILMPRVKGIDWAGLADEIRDGEVVEQPLRLTLCRNLTRIIELLETHGCAHRDLSCGNVFIEPGTGEVCLIDFDSLFHSSVAMPSATTCGTEGYTAPYAWVNGNLDPHRTWCEGADRYGLALLNVEMLLVNRGAKATSDGGIFQQEELKTRSGKGIDSIVAALKAQYPEAASLLLQAIRSRTPTDCPPPGAWNSLFQGVSAATANQPKLTDLPDLTDRIVDVVARSRPAAPLWPAPTLRDLPAFVPQLPPQEYMTITSLELPPDPWAQDANPQVHTVRRS
jgi:serine/threonine protein kinase